MFSSSATVRAVDYLTHDRTGVRDDVHVVDLAQGPSGALFDSQQDTGVHSWSFGTGQGYPVLDMVNGFEGVSGVSTRCKIVNRRAWDIAVCYSLPGKALASLG